MKFILASLAIVTFATYANSDGGLDVVNDDKLVNKIKSDDFVAVLFTKPQCPECDALETKLFNLQSEIKDMLQSDVVKVVDSQLLRLYSSNKEPALVFFRQGVPLLYDGLSNGDEMLQYLYENRSPAVQELFDENFEHLTQASTGATTGDWFVMFTNRECVDCQRFTAIWEAVGAATRNRLNVARIDTGPLGAKTAKRFKVFDAPAFIFIRLGKFYRYEISQKDVKSFVSFATEFYRNARAEKIEVPASPFDDLVISVVNFIKEIQAKGMHVLLNDIRFLAGTAVLSLGLLAIVILKCLVRRDKSATFKNKNE